MSEWQAMQDAIGLPVSFAVSAYAPAPRAASCASAKPVLLLANHVGDLAAISEALRRRDGRGTG